MIKNLILGILISVLLLYFGYYLSRQDPNPKTYLFLFIALDSLLSIITGIILFPIVHYNKRTAIKLSFLTISANNILVSFFRLSLFSMYASRYLGIEFLLNLVIGVIMLITAFRVYRHL